MVEVMRRGADRDDVHVTGPGWLPVGSSPAGGPRLSAAHGLTVGRRFVVRITRRAIASARRLLPAWAGGRLRPALPVHRLLGSSDLDSLISFWNARDRPGPSSWLAEALSDPRRFGVGIFHDSALVAAGWCGRTWERIGLPGHWFYNDQVRRDLRGRGLGQALHRARMAEAMRRGIKIVYADVTVDNDASLGSFRAVGFWPVDQPEWCARIRAARREQGRRDVEVVVLRRVLTAGDGS